MSNIVAIVGRPNVGKSTLFNRLTESMNAIVDDQSGVTRDRHYGEGEWTGHPFTVIDTGGYVEGSDDIFEAEIRKQVKLAVDEADIILFIVDARDGLNNYDTDIAKLLRKSKKKIFLVVNKVDTPKQLDDASEFYSLGLGAYFCISSANGSGTGELLDAVVKEFKPETEPGEQLPKLTIIGQPNVGKSSLLNTLTGIDRSIVTPIAGTTRDSINIRYNSFGFDFILVDTAGMRKKAKVHDDLEFYSVMRSIRAIEQADVCLLMVDATQGFTAQDINVFHLTQANHKGVVILVNKWDIVDKEKYNTKSFTEEIKNRLAPFTDVPILFTSVINKQRIHKALETAIQVYNNRQRHIPTSKLNKLMLPLIETFPPAAIKGKLVSIKYITQVPGPYPRFVFFSSNPQYIQTSYRRFLENKLRENFELTGVPVSISFRSKDSGKEV
jgi:GTP-binding protein